MTDRPDLQRLADHLRVLGNPNRLELLYELRTPQAVSDLELSPESVREGENPARPISHQAVRNHLDKLQSIDVVSIQRREREGHVLDEHVLNHQRLFAIVEELRSLGELKAREPAPDEKTMPAQPRSEVEQTSGPRLLLVRGQREGRVFELDDANFAPDAGWVIGRKQGLAVSLDYDPFVSSENSEIHLAEDGFEIVDRPESENGTYVNFEQLPPQTPRPIEQGDVITVGKTNLVFRHD